MKWMNETGFYVKRAISVYHFVSVLPNIVWAAHLRIAIYRASCQKLELTLQFLYLSNLSDCLLLQMCLKDFKLLFCHGRTHREGRPLFFKPFNCLLEMVNFTAQVPNLILVSFVSWYWSFSSKGFVVINFFIWDVLPIFRFLLQSIDLIGHFLV